MDSEHNHAPTVLRLRRSAPALGLALLTGFAACADEQVFTTSRNLDRPGPMALVCAGRAGDAGASTGLGLSSCTSDAGVGNTAGTLFGFVANTSKGEVSLFRPESSGELLVDLDPSNLGFGFIPVGSLPSDLKSSTDGCRVVTANSGSCDLSLIDVPSVMKVAAGESSLPSGAAVSTVVPRTAAGPLRARPRELYFLPTTPAAGEVCPARGEYRVFATFPGCGLVAEVDLSTGMILQGLYIGPRAGPAGYLLTDNPTCPVECVMRRETRRVDSGSLDPPAPDTMAADAPRPDSTVSPDAAPADSAPTTDGPRLDSQPADAGVAPPPPVDLGGDQAADAPGPADAGPDLNTNPRPHGLAINETGDRLYISSASAGYITAVDLAPSDGAMSNPRRILLEGGAATTRIKLSPSGARVGQFLYAIALDRSVRVISTVQEKECETNFDLSRSDAGTIPIEQAQCFTVGDPLTPPRRVTASGPGFRFPSIPQELAFVSNDGAGTQVDGGVTAVPLNGIFALVALSEGSIYVIDVEDRNYIDPQTVGLPPDHLPHRVRNGLQGFSTGDAGAAVAAVTNPGGGGVPLVVSEELTPNTESSILLPDDGVYIVGRGESMQNEWSLVYEDRLVARWSGQLSVTDQTGLTLSDRGVDLCGAGVVGRELQGGRAVTHGDILVVVGCKDDNECGLGQVCAKPVALAVEYGLCLEEDQRDILFQRCSEYLQNDREFLITRATQGELTLDSLPTEPQAVIKQDPQPQGGCQSNDDCADTFLCALEDQPNETPGRAISAGECFRPGCRTNADCGTGFCEAPLDGSPPVCVPVRLPLEIDRNCTTDDDCRAAGGLPAACSDDRSCGDPMAECRKVSSEMADPQCFDKGMFCAKYPGLKNRCIRRSPCFSELLRYDVVMGRSFKIGSYRRGGVVDPQTRECGARSDKSPLLVDRIPIGLPVYPAIIGPRCSESVGPMALLSPNPCFERTPAGYAGYVEKGEGTSIRFVDTGPSTVVRYTNPDIWFSLGLSHLTALVDSSNADSGEQLPFLYAPMPDRGLTIQLTVHSGYGRFLSDSSGAISLPTVLQEGPDGYVYMVDTGDQLGNTGNNGQVVRFSRSSLLFDDFQVR